MPSGLLVEILALGVIGYSLITSFLLLFILVKIELNMFFRGAIACVICLFCVSIYVSLRAEFIVLSHLSLVFAGGTGYLLMLLSFKRWSRAEIDL